MATLLRHMNKAHLRVREVVSDTHYTADLTLGLAEVVHDYLA